MVKPISTEKWTYERLLQELPSESRYEIRNFNLTDMPAPTIEHQQIVGLVYRLLFQFAFQNQLGEVFVSPLDVVFDRGNVCEPDVIFVASENKQIVGRKNISGSPDLVVEVVSKGSVVRDYVEKKNDYETFGVKEYWLIDPLNETVIVYALNEENKYTIFSSVEEQGIAKSKLLDGFELAFEEIFVSE